MQTANYWIDKLNLKEHPEGGFYKEVYRAGEIITKNSLPDRYQHDRSLATSIYFLLQADEFSCFHKLLSDEIWHFYQGTTLELYILEHDNLITHKLGADFDQHESLQIAIPRNHWFGARVIDKESYALVGCTMAPGFHFKDFEIADRAKLLDEFPKHKKIIKELTFA